VVVSTGSLRIQFKLINLPIFDFFIRYCVFRLVSINELEEHIALCAPLLAKPDSHVSSSALVVKLIDVLEPLNIESVSHTHTLSHPLFRIYSLTPTLSLSHILSHTYSLSRICSLTLYNTYRTL
jgi:hypothetical protein